jgi:RES domain-containing protein
MRIAWRITKTRHHPYDGGGAMLVGGRWNSPGSAVIYAADSFAGSLLEILVNAARPRTLPGPHHAVRIQIPEDIIEEAAVAAVSDWDVPGSPGAVACGVRWLRERRSAVLDVPALPSRPVGRTLVINPVHPDAGAITVSEPFTVPWDERLF